MLGRPAKQSRPCVAEACTSIRHDCGRAGETTVVEMFIHATSHGAAKADAFRCIQERSGHNKIVRITEQIAAIDIEECKSVLKWSVITVDGSHLLEIFPVISDAW